MTHAMNPPKQGLYDPRYEHDSCGVGFVVDLKDRKSHDIVGQALQILMQPGAPRRLRLREEHRRRRRHPRADAARLPGARVRPARRPPAAAGRLRRRLVFLPTDAGDRRRCRGDVRARSCARKGRQSSAGATCRSDPSPLGNDRARPSRSIRQIFIGRGPLPDHPDGLAFERKLYVIRRRVENEVEPVGRGAARRCSTSLSLSCRTLIYKGMLNAGQVGRSSPTWPTRRWSRPWRWSIRASAPTRSPAGRARTPTATSPTTARSTRCAATSTG